jgi:hypothetical protein
LGGIKKPVVSRQNLPEKKFGTNPTVPSYSASVVTIYNATNSIAHFQKKIVLVFSISFYKNARIKS